MEWYKQGQLHCPEISQTWAASLWPKTIFPAHLTIPRQKLQNIKNQQPAKMTLLSHYCLPEAMLSHIQIFPHCSHPLGKFGSSQSLEKSEYPCTPELTELTQQWGRTENLVGKIGLGEG